MLDAFLRCLSILHYSLTITSGARKPIGSLDTGSGIQHRLIWLGYTTGKLSMSASLGIFPKEDLSSLGLIVSAHSKQFSVEP